MGGGLAVEVVKWFVHEVERGAMTPGRAFPAERSVTRRLRVGRGAVREAKERLMGQGLLVPDDRGILRVAAPGAAFRSKREPWFSLEGDIPDEEFTRRVHGVLALRRAVLPEALEVALNFASPEEHALLSERANDWALCVMVRVAWRELRDAHLGMLTAAATVSRHDTFLASAHRIAACLQEQYELWSTMVEQRARWAEAIFRMKELCEERKARAVADAVRDVCRAADEDLARGCVEVRTRLRKNAPAG